jgi:N-carbamoyl-L-amino-acid hydrolase
MQVRVERMQPGSDADAAPVMTSGPSGLAAMQALEAADRKTARPLAYVVVTDDDSPPPEPAPYAFVELGIEPVPDAALGVASGMQGLAWTEFRLTGRADHAGTAPMRGRRDPLYVAAQVVTYVRRLARETDGLRATVGRLSLDPDEVNVVPGCTTFTVDLRHPGDEALTLAHDHVREYVGFTAAREDVELSARTLAHRPPVTFDKTVIATIEAAASDRRLSTVQLPSAGDHPARTMVPVCPTGLLLIPSAEGLEDGIAVLMDVLVDLAS